ncbi:musculin-like [Diabrotica undecimpunctata]|uniref:musculin-like n=1 Tax=Diabrotica undecimpunctata TaxID=50387 RepID=UPI003B632C36
MPRKRRSPETDSEDEHDDSRRPQRNAANERERARMRVLSKAFCRLKTTLPWVPADTKLSKLDTLRLATSYIAHLRAVLMDQPVSGDNLPKHPLTLTWPFTFQRCPDSTTDVVDERDQHVWAHEGPIQSIIREKDISYFY